MGATELPRLAVYEEPSGLKLVVRYFLDAIKESAERKALRCHSLHKVRGSEATIGGFLLVNGAAGRSPAAKHVDMADVACSWLQSPRDLTME